MIMKHEPKCVNLPLTARVVDAAGDTVSSCTDVPAGVDGSVGDDDGGKAEESGAADVDAGPAAGDASEVSKRQRKHMQLVAVGCNG